jgi:hypothetical protein
MKSALLVVVFCSLFGAVTPASAQISQLGTYGFWRVYGGKSNDGTPMCGTAIYNDNRSRSLHIKHFKNDGYLTIHMFKDSWKIPSGTDVNISLQVDSHPRWVAKYKGYNNMLEWPIGISNLDRFLNEFRIGLKMRVSFPDGDENDWVVSLSGSSAAMNGFFQCAGRLTLGSDNSQPHGSGRSQPHQVPSQPFAPKPVPAPSTGPRT